ncbi:LuxR C-terminal-related transcriptional regulator [Kitasatospora sp. NBC_00458]|uniref:LuxR C-terminal-related transcriptional regulator n=1 Tax=Kitasatospora sp. NBC_00458 TaxID=2903568 RepID=UPI002E180918
MTRPLTQREADAMRYATAGLDPAQIALHLDVTTSAVRATLQRAIRKLGGRDLHHAIQIHNQPSPTRR